MTLAPWFAALIEAALRSMALAGMVALAVRLANLRDPAARLRIWTAVLAAALLMPALNHLAPQIAFPLPAAAALPAAQSVWLTAPDPIPAAPVPEPARLPVPEILYVAGLCGFAVRLAAGALWSRRLRRSARPVTDCPEFARLSAALRTPPALMESARVLVPVTCGWLRPALYLPEDWRTWDGRKQRSVIAHELSHVARRDALTQWLSNVHRAIFWFSPLAWWLDRVIRDACEQASDAEVLAGSGDRAHYAEVILGFAAARGNAGRRFVMEEGVHMARLSTAGRRIERILNETWHAAPRGLRWPGVALVVAPLIYLAAAFGLARSAAPPVPAIAAVAPIPENAAIPPSPPAQAAPAPQPVPGAPAEPEERSNARAFAIISGDQMTMSGGKGDMARARSYAAKFPGEYLWVRQASKEYVISDAAMLAEVKSYFKPQEELGRQMSLLGDEMSKLGEQMSKLGEQMSDVRVDMPDLSNEMRQLSQEMAEAKSRKASMHDLGELQRRMGELQRRLGDAQAIAGNQQARIGREQGKIGEQQAKLGNQQAEVGRRQAAQAREADRKVWALLEGAIRSGKAQRVYPTL